MPRRVILVSAWWALLCGNAFGQSRLADVITKVCRTGDLAVCRQALWAVEASGVDVKMEIPVLLDMILHDNDPVIANYARSEIQTLAMQHRTDGDPFRAAISVFEAHLAGESSGDKAPGKGPWSTSIVMLEAIFGFPPSPRVAALMYEMADLKNDPWAQGLALEALSNLQPIPPEAKKLFKSRMVKTVGKVSGPDLLPHLAPGLSDLDVLQMFLVSAQSSDAMERQVATRTLANMNQIPPQVAEVFRRLALREDLSESVAAAVRGAISRVDHPAPK